MKKSKTVTSGWLFGPQPTNEHIEIVKLGWYYLGASDHPELIRVLDVTGDMFTYIKQIDFMQQTGKPARIETSIGRDLISMANRTMRKHAESYRKQAETLFYMRGHAEQVEYVIARHDLDEETKQYMDMRQAEAEVYPRDTDAHGRLSNWEYMIEDAMREKMRIEQRNNDYWWEFDTTYPPFDTVVYEPFVCDACGLGVNEIAADSQGHVVCTDCESRLKHPLTAIAIWAAKTGYTPEGFARLSWDAKIENGLGFALSHYFMWEGARVLAVCANGLEDANFHAESSIVRGLI